MDGQESVAPCPLCLSSGPVPEVTHASSPCPEGDCLGSCSQIFAPDALAVKQCLWLLLYRSGCVQCQKRPCTGKSCITVSLWLFFLGVQIQRSNNLILCYNLILRKFYFLHSSWCNWLKAFDCCLNFGNDVLVIGMPFLPCQLLHGGASGPFSRGSFNLFP